jgi:uncharacterized membrane protein HdeD (DUF308 family)
MSNPRTAGPNGDGSKSLAPESKTGLTVSAILFIALQVIAQGLSGLDTSNWSGWWVPVVTAAVSTAVGLITAYLKSNR